MTKLIENFTAFMHGILKFLLAVDLIAGIGLACISIEGFSISVLIFGFIAVLAFLLGYKFINMNMGSKYKLLLILIIGFSLRVLWLINVSSIPTSDFKTIYDSAGNFLNGDKSMFYGISYLRRFPHLTIFTLYMAFIRFIFPISNLLAMKIINLLFSIIVLLLIYLIINNLYRNKEYALKGVLIGALFPPFISYVGVFCSENIAMPFYLLSILLFLLAIKRENKLWLFILSTATLAIGNLFRMVAVIVLIAFSMYILIYEINLFYLILCGYGLTYLITEAQPRYSYIVIWIFIILSINGLDKAPSKIFRNSFVFYYDSLKRNNL